MLRAPPRKASAMPRPMMISGTARTSVAEVRAYQEPDGALPERRERGRRVVSRELAGPPRARAAPAASRASGVLAATGHHQLAHLARGWRRAAPRSACRATPPAPGRPARAPRRGRSSTPAPPRPPRPPRGAARGSPRRRGDRARGSGSPPRPPAAAGPARAPPPPSADCRRSASAAGASGPGRHDSVLLEQRRRARPRHPPVDPAAPNPGIVGAASRARRSR